MKVISFIQILPLLKLQWYLLENHLLQNLWYWPNISGQCSQHSIFPENKKPKIFYVLGMYNGNIQEGFSTNTLSKISGSRHDNKAEMHQWCSLINNIIWHHQFGHLTSTYFIDYNNVLFDNVTKKSGWLWRQYTNFQHIIIWVLKIKSIRK